jgi:hypothetical protein
LASCRGKLTPNWGCSRVGFLPGLLLMQKSRRPTRVASRAVGGATATEPRPRIAPLLLAYQEDLDPRSNSSEEKGIPRTNGRWRCCPHLKKRTKPRGQGTCRSPRLHAALSPLLRVAGVSCPSSTPSKRLVALARDTPCQAEDGSGKECGTPHAVACSRTRTAEPQPPRPPSEHSN